MPDSPLPPTVSTQIQCIIQVFEFYSYSDIQIKPIRHSIIITAKGIKGRHSVTVHYGNRPFTDYPADKVCVAEGIYLEFCRFSYYLLENAT